MKKEELTKILKDKKINPTYQRIIILDFLISDYNHSSCDEIYNKLSKKYPIINRATVYNTLNLFYDIRKKIMAILFVRSVLRYMILM